MSDWVNVHVESIMHNSRNFQGYLTNGLAFYFNKIIENQERIIKLLERKEAPK